MRKREELTNPNSCLNRARDDEMIFVLLERDEAACDTVRYWINKRIELGKNKPTDDKIVSAWEWIRTVEAELARKHTADVSPGAIEIPIDEFDGLVRSKSFVEGPFISQFGNGQGEPYNPAKAVWGTLNDGRKVKSVKPGT